MEQSYGEVHLLISKNLLTRKMSLNDCYVINLGQEKIVLSLQKDLNQWSPQTPGMHSNHCTVRRLEGSKAI